jgi:hypothetical protein
MKTGSAAGVAYYGNTGREERRGKRERRDETGAVGGGRTEKRGQ